MASTVDPMDRIIWSADVPDEETLIRYLGQMPRLRIVKIDRLFVTEVGLDVIGRLQQERGVQVFDDAKIIEIPSKMEGIAEKHLKRRPWMLNCMAGGMSSRVLEHEDIEKIDGLKRFADACHRVGTKPCAVTVLTSKAPEVAVQEFSRSALDQVLFYADMLLECGFTDIVCSPKELATIRAESRFDVLDINTPGIRPAGAEQGDQARSDTPEAAIIAGANRLVIGRPITTGNPAENLQKIGESIYLAAMKRAIQPGQASPL